MTVASNHHLAAILFDLDATLIDTRQLYTQAFDRAFRDQLGLELSAAERQLYMELPTLDFLMQYAHGAQLATLNEAVKANIDALMSQVRMFPGVNGLLERLRAAGLRLAVVTSQTRAELDVTREALQIEAWIDAWVAADDAARPKPDPAPVRLALRQVNASPEQALFVGDSLPDLHAGRAAGVRVAAALWGAGDPKTMLAFRPDEILTTPQDLLSLLGLQ